MIKDSLYYQNPYQSTFTATVLSCEPSKDGFAVVLDNTAFYPEGGGEPCDTGTLGGVQVVNVQEHGDVIVHTCTDALPVGGSVEGVVDIERRLFYMRRHTGEHIFTGCLNHLTGAENVGFHMGPQVVTVDYDREISPDLLDRAERDANDAVMRNLAVDCYVPNDEQLGVLPYRLKKEISGDTRLVEIPDIDRCACCGLHVAMTGEVGLIKVTSYARYKGGCRILLCIADAALLDYREKQREVQAVTMLTSAKPENISGAVADLLQRESELKAALAAERELHYRLIADTTVPHDGVAVAELPDADMPSLRLLADLCKQKHGSSVALSPDGNGGFKLAVASAQGKATDAMNALKTAFHARGGGDKSLVQGTVTADKDALLALVMPILNTDDQKE